LQDPPKFSPKGIFGLKKFYLATPVSSFPLLIFFVLCWKWLYESPLWSVKNSKSGDAIKTLTAIRGSNYKVIESFIALDRFNKKWL
jgi:hypothetical protein